MKEQNETLIRRWYQEVWTENKEYAINDMMHDNVEAYGLGEEPVVGVDNFKAFYKAFKSTLSDMKITVDKVLNDGDFVTALCTVEGTDTKSNKRVKFSGTSITEIKDGKISKGWNHFDFLSYNLQLGKIKSEQLL